MATALQDRFLDVNPCFGCGPDTVDGIRLKSYEDGEELVARWVPDERFQGPPGVVNGGIMAVPMDCHGTWAAMWALGRRHGGDPVDAVTAGYCVRLVAPTPVGGAVELRARIRDVTDRKAKVEVEATVDGATVATFDGTFVAVADRSSR